MEPSYTLSESDLDKLLRRLWQSGYDAGISTHRLARDVEAQREALLRVTLADAEHTSEGR